MALLFILAFVTFVFLTKECEECYGRYRYTHCAKPMAEAVRAYEECIAAAREAVSAFFVWANRVRMEDARLFGKRF
jgi:hypothetical protein